VNWKIISHNFRKNIIGADATFVTPFGEQKLILRGLDCKRKRLYKPIEEKTL